MYTMLVLWCLLLINCLTNDGNASDNDVKRSRPHVTVGALALNMVIDLHSSYNYTHVYPICIIFSL